MKTVHQHASLDLVQVLAQRWRLWLCRGQRAEAAHSANGEQEEGFAEMIRLPSAEFGLHPQPQPHHTPASQPPPCPT